MHSLYRPSALDQISTGFSATVFILLILYAAYVHPMHVQKLGALLDQYPLSAYAPPVDLQIRQSDVPTKPIPEEIPEPTYFRL